MQIFRSLAPAAAHAGPREAVRAGLGALLGLGIAGLFLLSPGIDLQTGLYLVAPFGASSVLLFAVPNSPLAQPWNAVVGNTVAALVGVAVCLTVADPALRIALAVGLAITATILCRAIHPPAGAVAMTAAMSPDAVAELGFRFALAPIAAGTIALVLLAALYARLTGRHYPFRQFDDPNTHGTEDAEPAERLGLSEEELVGILERYRQSFNLGVEDLARLIGAAELQAASHSVGPLTAGDIMSRDLVTVTPETSLSALAAMFTRHRFTSLPVTRDDRYLGIIFQMDLIAVADYRHGVSGAFDRLRARDGDARRRAESVMRSDTPKAVKATPISALLPLMADGDVDAVPVLEGETLVGIVTRTDLIAALARQVART
ncbi:HPP family protein [Paracoccaceae bacterium GXU_MW_L88]